MGDLILMSRTYPRPPQSQAASAEILFFTGVRYYRMTEDASKPAGVPVVAAATGKRARAAMRRRRADRVRPGQLEASV